MVVPDDVSEEVIFEFEGNENYSLGQMTFHCDDLKINVLNLKTLIANTYVVNTKNPYFLFVRDGGYFS